MRNYIIRRVLQMVVTLILVSIMTFVVIQLPPGDYLTSYVAQLSQAGQTMDQETLRSLEIRYGLDQPMYVQYFKWIGGFARGDFGYSFDWKMPVRPLIAERLVLTIILTLFTMVFTWIVAFLIGVYSASHKYSIGDYLATFVGFIGISIPGFLLAMIVMWMAISVFNTSVGGLFSTQYVNAAWSWARWKDLLSHITLPAVIIGLSGTASLIRTLRANLLDELTKPYVSAAKAKGVPVRRLMLKYPLRIAMLPFISTVGWTIPDIISSQTIVGVVLSLPILGPMLLTSLKNQDMYLAGTILLFLSVLTVLGTFISDILLAWADPRVRY